MIYAQILVMALVTYLIRAIPIAVLRKDIKSRFLRSFLHYVPYVTLSVMAMPSILEATGDGMLGLIGFVVALISSYISGSLVLTALSSCLSVYICHFFF